MMSKKEIELVLADDKDTISNELVKIAANNYFLNGVVDDFSIIPTHQKLALLQKTPRRFIKKRAVGGTQIPYLPHDYAEKCLNIIFNFNVSNRIISHEFLEVNPKGKKAWEAEVLVEFEFIGDKGQKITRSVYSSHKGYENPATTRGDAMKAAISKSWTVVARTFGIGSNLTEKENEAYVEIRNNQKKEEEAEKPTPVQKTEPVKKDWSKFK